MYNYYFRFAELEEFENQLMVFVFLKISSEYKFRSVWNRLEMCADCTEGIVKSY